MKNKPATTKKKEAPKKKVAKKILRKFQGKVVSDKMDKTLVVLVSTVKLHPRYHKRFRIDKKYKVHDPKNQFKEGDDVVFIPSKPYSKDKRWEVLY